MFAILDLFCFTAAIFFGWNDERALSAAFFAWSCAFSARHKLEQLSDTVAKIQSKL